MKKKVLAILFAIVLVATSLIALTACKEEKTDDYALVYGKKYIYSSDVRVKVTEQRYFIYYRNNTCKYHYYSTATTAENEVLTFEFTVDYRFTFVDGDNSSIVYFYDSVTDDSTYADANGNVGSLADSEYWKTHSELYSDYLPKTDDCGLITVSNNVLCTAGAFGYAFFVNEDYVNSIPNFGVSAEE